MAASATVVMLVVYVPQLQVAFGTVPLPHGALVIACVFGLVPLATVEVAKALLRRFAPGWAEA